ncbi:MAG: SpoIIIAC/SpoIIIAD family protein [Angelakisella sp.]
MTMNVTAVVMFCIISAILSLVLRQKSPEFAMVLSMICSVVVILYLMEGIVQIKEELTRILAGAALPPQLLEVVFKGLGICILSELAGQSCRDAGEGAIALKAELAGKIAITLISMPLFYKLLSIASGLLSVGL